MAKFKLFVENFIVYGFGGLVSKLIPIIMVPIITRLMPDSTYFGINDLSNTIISFCSALSIMGMYDAMYRMFFEKGDDDYKKSVCSTALAFTLCTSFVVFVIMLLLRKTIARYFLGDSQLAYVVYITAMATLVGATNSIVSAPTRMQNNRRVFLITNTVSPVLSYSISIPMLLKGHYVIALPLAAVISGAAMEATFLFLNRKWFSRRRFDPGLLRPLLAIAVPLMPNFLVYWIFNSCDRLMITNMMDIGAAGIYSVGSKLGQASQLIYTAFAGGWQYFAFSTMKEKDQVKTNSLVFEYLGVISFAAGLYICAWSYPIFKLLFVGEYVGGYVVSPYLFMAPLLQMLFQVAANQFLVVKKTWPNILILSSGAIINVLVNLLWIPWLGIEGAALATLLGYAVVDVVCVMVLCKMKLMVVSGRFFLVLVIMITCTIIWRLFLREAILYSTIMAIIVTMTFLFLYKKDILILLKRTNL